MQVALTNFCIQPGRYFVVYSFTDLVLHSYFCSFRDLKLYKSRYLLHATGL